MKKTHLSYLQRGIGLAIKLRASDAILENMVKMKAGNVPIYGLVRDIVSDVRFYSVTESDDFWRKYSEHVACHFIESLSDLDWENEISRTEKKESFLNEWFANHLFYLSEDEKKKKIRALAFGQGNDGVQMDGDNSVDTDDADGQPSESPSKVDDRIYDCSNGCNNNSQDLPDEMKDYQQEIQTKENRKDDQMQKPNHGLGAGSPYTAEVKFLNNIDPEIVRLAEMIGRAGEFDTEQTGKFLHSSKSDICGITIGNDLNSVLPSELALLADRRTESLFLHRYTQKRLQTFASASKSIKKGESKCGPIFLCLDTSNSMSGKPEDMAKMLSLAVAIVAQRKNRPVILLNYSYTVSFFVLKNLKRQKQKLLKFLSVSYSGGNDENILFNFALKGIYTLPQYEKLLQMFDGADFLVVSDFEWGHIAEDIRNLLMSKRQDGVRFYALGVNFWGGRTDSLNEKIDFDECRNGYDFFRCCDEKFIYDETIEQISK